MSRVRNRACFVILLACIAVLVFALNAHTPLMMDDYDYSFSWSTGERLDGIADIIDSQAAHYRMWGGRSVTHFLAQLFLYLGKPVFNLANTVMYLLLLLEIHALSKRRETEWNWLVILATHLLLFATVEFFGVAFLWLDGACNYLWGTVLALVPLLIARSERESGYFDCDGPHGWLALPLCFLAGWTNENTACGVLAALLLLLVWDVIQKRRIRFWRAASLVVQTLGVAVMLLAPGNFARAGEEASRTMIMELVYRAVVVCYCMLRYVGIPMLFAAVVLFAAAKRKTSLRVEWLCVLGAAALLSAGALTGSPQISDRSFTAVIVLMIGLLMTALADMKRITSRCSTYLGGVLAVLSVLLGVYALGAVRAHGRAWEAQIAVIEQAAASGEEEVTVSSVLSDSRYTMNIELSDDPSAWPNTTLSKFYGVRIAGQ